MPFMERINKIAKVFNSLLKNIIFLCPIRLYATKCSFDEES